MSEPSLEPPVASPLRSLTRATRTSAGKIRRALRGWIDRMMHPGRRRRASEQVRALPHRPNILILCTGNVCRSPYAEARLRAAAEEHGLVVETSSAGFIGPGRPPPETARSVARDRGLDTSTHVSRQVSGDLLLEVDMIVVMEPAHVRRLRRIDGGRRPSVLLLGDLDPASGEPRAIPDPWSGGAEEFESCFARIDRCVDALLREVSRPRRQSDPEGA